MTALSLAGALVIGAAYGYVSQRGAFCMNSGFRFAVERRDFTKVKALGLAVAIQMLALPLLFEVQLAQVTFPAFHPVGAIVGGLLFGASMVWAGGCAAGVWYKLGGGSLGAIAAIVGMALGAAMLEVGPLSWLRTEVAGPPTAFHPAEALDLPLFVPMVVAGLALLVVLWRAKDGVAGDWSWRRTGALIGIVGVAAWPLSELADRSFGLAVVPGSVGLASAVGGALDGLLSWDVVLVLGIPVGAFVASRRVAERDGERPAFLTLVRMLVGGIGLGVGASLAAGCTVGHGLTGLPLLAPGSVVTMAAIFAGSATVALLGAALAKQGAGGAGGAA